MYTEVRIVHNAQNCTLHKTSKHTHTYTQTHTQQSCMQLQSLTVSSAVKIMCFSTMYWTSPSYTIASLGCAKRHKMRLYRVSTTVHSQGMYFNLQVKAVMHCIIKQRKGARNTSVFPNWLMKQISTILHHRLPTSRTSFVFMDVWKVCAARDVVTYIKQLSKLDFLNCGI